jgi:hypothetical protein
MRSNLTVATCGFSASKSRDIFDCLPTDYQKASLYTSSVLRKLLSINVGYSFDAQRII